jgi:hypothetical protein
MSPLAASLTLATAVLASLGAAAPHRYQSGHRGLKVPVGKAVYFLSNEQENAVGAMRIGKDGTLSTVTMTKTGGAGSINIDAMTGQPAATDALLSQQALKVAGDVSTA